MDRKRSNRWEPEERAIDSSADATVVDGDVPLAGEVTRVVGGSPHLFWTQPAGVVGAALSGLLTIGRGRGETVRLTDDAVSTRHAQVSLAGGRWVLEDLGSTNGTFVGPSRIHTLPLAEGATFRIGQTTFWYVENAVVCDGCRLRLELVEGPARGQHLEVAGRAVLGRTNADLVLDVEGVSRRHAEFQVLGPDLAFLRDLGSRNGVGLNDEVVRDSTVRLHEGDILHVGASTCRVRLVDSTNANRADEDAAERWRGDAATEALDLATVRGDMTSSTASRGDAGRYLPTTGPQLPGIPSTGALRTPASGAPMDPAPAEAPSPDEPLAEEPPPSRRASFVRALLRARTIVPLLLLGSTLAASLVRINVRVSADAVLAPLQVAALRPRIGGFLKQLAVRSRESVRKGQVVALLDDTDLQLQIRQTAFSMAQEEARRSRLIRGATADEVRVARKEVERLRIAAHFARQAATRSQKLLAQGLVMRDVSDRHQREATESNAAWEVAKARLASLVAGPRHESVKVIDEKLKALRLAGEGLARKRADMTIRSPIDGVVVTPDVHQRLGMFIKPGDEVMEVQNVATLEVRMSVPEAELDILREGQPVSLKLRSFPNETLAASVASVAPWVDSNASGRHLDVRALLPNPQHRFRPGLSGSATILCGRRTVLSYLYRRAMRWVRVDLLPW